MYFNQLTCLFLEHVVSVNFQLILWKIERTYTFIYTNSSSTNSSSNLFSYSNSVWTTFEEVLPGIMSKYAHNRIIYEISSYINLEAKLFLLIRFNSLQRLWYNNLITLELFSLMSILFTSCRLYYTNFHFRLICFSTSQLDWNLLLSINFVFSYSEVLYYIRHLV